MGMITSPNLTTDGLMLYYDVANTRGFPGVPTTNYLSNPTQTFNSSEFQQYYDLREIFETYGLVPYSLSFEARANISGYCLVYMQNGSYTKYAFVGSEISLTTEWTRYKFENITPSGPTSAWQTNTPSDNRAMLATYTIYGSGRYPQVRNMQLELGSVATPFVAGTRGTTVATGGGFVDLSGNGRHGEVINGPTYSSNSAGGLVFDGVNDYIVTPGMALGTDRTVEITYKMNSVGSGWGPWFRGDWYERMFPTSIVIINSNGVYYSLDGPIDDTNIRTICYSIGGTSLKSYRNGQLITNTTMNGPMGTGTYSFYSGYQCGGSTCTYSPCTIYNIKMYNRQLSDEEVLRNFEIQRARFGV
jgi:hypothetical protein